MPIPVTETLDELTTKSTLLLQVSCCCRVIQSRIYIGLHCILHIVLWACKSTDEMLLPGKEALD